MKNFAILLYSILLFSCSLNESFKEGKYYKVINKDNDNKIFVLDTSKFIDVVSFNKNYLIKDEKGKKVLAVLKDNILIMDNNCKVFFDEFENLLTLTCGTNSVDYMNKKQLKNYLKLINEEKLSNYIRKKTKIKEYNYIKDIVIGDFNNDGKLPDFAYITGEQEGGGFLNAKLEILYAGKIRPYTVYKQDFTKRNSKYWDMKLEGDSRYDNCIGRVFHVTLLGPDINKEIWILEGYNKRYDIYDYEPTCPG